MKQKGRLAISLSWIGGYTNVCALLAAGALVSHVTGTITQLGRSVGSGDTARACFFASLLASFCGGAMLSGLMTEVARREGWRSKYILPMAAEATLLGILACWLNAYPVASGRLPYGMACIACLAMGLQNGTITKISGAVVRTTHVSGIFTDLGLESVQFLFWCRDKLVTGRRDRAGRLLRISGRDPSAQRLLLLASIALSFGCGAVVGTVAYNHWSAHAFAFPALFLLGIIYMDLRSPIADIRELDLINDPELPSRALLNQLLPREVCIYRFACARSNRAHRAPDFQLWLDRVPPYCRVVIVAISPWTRFNANAVMDLRAAVEKLHADGRKLILGGVTPAQFDALDDLGVARMMDKRNVCPDLEFALARAMLTIEEMRALAHGHVEPRNPVAA